MRFWHNASTQNLGRDIMKLNTIKMQKADSAGIITLNRPTKRNAISLEMMSEIREVALAFQADADIRSVIVTGNNDCFSAGADLTEAIEVSSPAEGLRYFGSLHLLNATLEDLSKPIIAAIEGFCFTGGCELALACDLRVAGSGATFAITSSRIGTIPGAGATQRLPRLVGKANALAMLLLAEPIEAEEAFRIGLINKVASKGQALETALAMAATLSRRAPLSLALIKTAVHQGLDMDLAAGIEFEKQTTVRIYGSEDKREGISAFLEKREPRFVGK
jgi:enoyl-CoA hydratase/carnithine racemase